MAYQMLLQTAAALALTSAALPATSEGAPSTQSAPRSRDTAQDRNREICVRAVLTGSRLPRTICRTSLEWDAAGGLPTVD